ncbi:MAG TPA: gluconate 2-dehydrogenase subunit 3 family protein [Microthrixaceae bacterium]|nr:gluconate 2-dehydrogenase subunit 3 family protein [Microthrixaceae bacterium]
MPDWLTEAELAALSAALDTVMPGDALGPGAGEAGGANFVDRVLGAFLFDPPHIWAGGPFSGRHGGVAGFDGWLPLGAAEELGWRVRIEGSLGRPEREFNGAIRGWQEVYRDGLAGLGDDFAHLGLDEREARLAEAPEELRDLLFAHACQSLYGDPVYGGNRDGAGWDAIGFAGDTQPRGWTDDEVTFGG